MDSRKEQYAAEHGLKSRHPEITAVGKPVDVNYLDHLSIDRECLAFEGVGDHYIRKRLGSPSPSAAVPRLRVSSPHLRGWRLLSPVPRSPVPLGRPP